MYKHKQSDERWNSKHDVFADQGYLEGIRDLESLHDYLLTEVVDIIIGIQLTLVHFQQNTCEMYQGKEYRTL